jgi:hypothetical protein
MGNGIAHVCAQHGISVRLVDTDAAALARAVETIERNFDRQIKKGSLTEADKEAAIGRIETDGELEAAHAADLVVEAIVEDVAVKTDVFRTLDAIVQPEGILASNTSSISITRLGAATSRPDLTIGMHFMNPVPVMKLVEVIRGLETSDATHETVVGLSESLGKTPVTVSDYPGFVSNRILMPMINEGHGGCSGAGGHRHGDEARDESSDGPADAGRLRRVGCVPGHPRCAPRRVGRSEVPTLPFASSDGGRWPTGEEVRQGLLRVRLGPWRRNSSS